MPEYWILQVDQTETNDRSGWLTFISVIHGDQTLSRKEWFTERQVDGMWQAVAHFQAVKARTEFPNHSLEDTGDGDAPGESQQPLPF